MNYEKHYKALCYSRQLLNRQWTKPGTENRIYYEEHHIVPRHEAGSNEASNLVLLTAREHFIAHWLFAKWKRTSKAYCALAGFIRNSKEENKLNSRQYEICKIALSYERNWMRGENNPMFGKKQSDAGRLAISKARSGENNLNYGKKSWNNGTPQSNEAKQKKKQTELNKRLNYFDLMCPKIIKVSESKHILLKNGKDCLQLCQQYDIHYDKLKKLFCNKSNKLINGWRLFNSELNNSEFDCFIDAYKSIALSLISINGFCDTRLGDAVSAEKPFTISIKSLSDALELSNDAYIFDKMYAKAFAEHIISGCDKELRKLAPDSAKKFLDRPAELPENISVLYCDKIAKQIEFVLKELNENKNTRRAIISFIDSNDFKITELEPTKHLEFSCTAYLSFFIKENKLNVHINMRSQSFALLPLDANNFYNLHKHISSKLNIEQGKCFYTFSNLHLYRKHEKLAINIAELEYMH